MRVTTALPVVSVPVLSKANVSTAASVSRAAPPLKRTPPRAAADSADAVAVSHKGVIRAVYALASGWDLTGKAPAKLRDGCAQAFILESGGEPRIECLNIGLEAQCQPT